jgi:hypothetical protein
VPIYKQADKRDCSNYRGISLLLTAYKMLSDILSWLTPNAEKINGNHQCGFGCNRPTADHMLCIGQIVKKKKKKKEREYNEVVPQLFIDFKKTCM